MQYSRIAKLANRIQSRRAKRGQKGFTLLELLVVVAILAAIAGTATIALQDMDARASAAAHVAMMDEMNKGIATFRVLNKNVYPSYWDSLLESDTTTDAKAGVASTTDRGHAMGAGFVETLAIEDDLTIDTLDADTAAVLTDSGIDHLMYVARSTDADPADYGDCVDIKDLISNRGNAVVPGNIFLSPDANGCGYPAPVSTTMDVAVWNGNYERILGAAGRSADQGDTSGAPVMMAVGIGPSSTLFENGKLGSMTSVPVYRHVSGSDYNRFVALFSIGTINGTYSDPAAALAADAWSAIDQVNLVTIIDGAGDTKEEELGEWDGQRNTI